MPAYYNATTAQQKAYDDAITAGQKVLNNPNATQTQVNDAKTAIDNAKTALSGQATDSSALKTAVGDQAAIQKTPGYYNATPAHQQAYDNAVTAGQKVLDNPNATQTQVNDAKAAIDRAKSALSGQATDKSALKTAVDAQPDVKKTSAYYNATLKQQQAYDNAVTAGQKVLDDPNATQTQVNDAQKAIADAKAALSGQETDTSALKTAVDAQPDVKKTSAYYNAPQSEQDAYNKAVAAGQAVLSNPNATQTEVNDAKTAIDNAKVALSGQATDISALKTAVVDQPTVQKTPAYYNATPAQQQTYDNAVTAGQKVLDDPNATQAQVNSATQTINAAKDALSGQVTNKSALKMAVEDQDATQATPNYYNATPEAQAAYNKAITDGQAVLGNPDATQNEVTNALNAISMAKAALNGAATNMDSLKTAVENQGETQKTPAYYNATASQQQAYDNAVTAGQKVLDDPNATQDQVNSATKAINDAKAVLSGQPTQKDALQASVSAQNTVKTSPAYVNADPDLQAKYDQAITAGSQVLNDSLATQAEVNKATAEIRAAQRALNGVANLETEKEGANQAIDKALADKTNEINSSNLTDEEKNALIDQATQDANYAKNSIANATTGQEVTDALNTGVTQIQGIQVPTSSPAKDAADKAIDKALADKTAEINAASNLTNDEKQKLIDQATADAKDAKNKIAAAATGQEVTNASDAGVTQIQGIQVPTSSPAKDTADKAIDKALADKTAEINAAPNLTNDEKQKLIDQATADANDAKKNIANATTDQEVTNASDAGVSQIQGITVPKTSAAKDAANQAIEKALADKMAEINSSNLTNDEKQKLIDQVTQDAQDAKDNVAKATTDQEVTDATDAGVSQIQGITVPTSSPTKDAANKEIDKALADKTAEINAAPNLTNDEKQKLIDQATQDAANAKENVAKATTDQEVADASNTGVKQIQGIQVPTSSPVKDAADQAIDKALADKTAEINASNLTNEEKQKLTDQAIQDANDAKKNIANATTDQEVTNASDAGVSQIQGITVPTSSPAKDAADKAIDKALADKTAEINAVPNLTNDEKQKLIDQATQDANDAKKNIANATTNQEVVNATNSGVIRIKEIQATTHQMAPSTPRADSNQDAESMAASNSQNRSNTTASSQLGRGQAQANNIETGMDSSVTNKSTKLTGNNQANSRRAHLAKRLPQTGNKQERRTGLIGLALAEVAGALGLARLGRKRNEDK